MSVRLLRHDKRCGWFSKSRGVSASVSFLSSPPPPRLLAPFFAWPLLQNSTETLASQANPEKGISIHRIPFFNSENAAAQKRRKKWIDFVLARRKNWKPGRTSSLCSIHFKEDDFQHRMDSKMKRSLKSDEIGICVYPSIHAGEKDPEDIPTKRGKRMVR